MYAQLKVPLITILLLVAQLALADIHEIYLLADEVYSYARKGCSCDQLDEVQRYAKKTMNAAETVLFSVRSGARSVQMFAQSVYDYSRKAYRSDNFDEAVYYMQKAKSEASRLVSAALEIED